MAASAERPRRRAHPFTTRRRDAPGIRRLVRYFRTRRRAMKAGETLSEVVRSGPTHIDRSASLFFARLILHIVTAREQSQQADLISEDPSGGRGGARAHLQKRGVPTTRCRRGFRGDTQPTVNRQAPPPIDSPLSRRQRTTPSRASVSHHHTSTVTTENKPGVGAVGLWKKKLRGW
jgi:hypothetical protein